MIKLYPSGYVIPAGATLNSPYKEGCPRFYRWSKENPPKERFEIPLISRALGLLAELRLDNIVGRREVPIQLEVSPGVVVSGRIDILADDCIYEIKATASRNMFNSQIRKGVVSSKHLGQLITYMLILSRPAGKIVWSYIHFNRERTQLQFETHEFDVRLSPEGAITVDGVAYPYTAMQMMQYYQIMAEALLKPELPPMTADRNACKNCPLQKICENNPKDLEEFNRYVVKYAVTSETKVGTSYTSVLHAHNIRESKNE